VVNPKVLKTIDPDCWFKSDPESKEDLQAELRECKLDGNITFLSVLLVAAEEMSEAQKHKAALTYMEERKAISQDWKDSFLKVVKDWESAHARHCNQRDSMEAKEKFEKARQALKDAENTFSGKQSRKQIPQDKNTGSDSAKFNSTDYFFQILAAESVEKVFGHVLGRLILALKTKSPFVVQQREGLPAGGIPGAIASSTSSHNRDAEGDEGEARRSDDDGDDSPHVPAWIYGN
jgi:hypothetical protein